MYLHQSLQQILLITRILDYAHRGEISVGSTAKALPFRLYPCFICSRLACAAASSHACFTEDCVRTVYIICYSLRIYLRFFACTHPP